MSITTEYRGYTIRYDENQDTWGCYDCGVREAATLGKAKAQIDKLHLKLRKDAAFECYEVSISDTTKGMCVKVLEAQVIDYLGRKESRSWSGREVKFEGHKVASMAKRRIDSRKARQETMLHNLAPMTPEVNAAVAKADRLGAVAFEARKAFHAAVAAIPRVQFEDISDLVAASDHRFDETDS